MILLLVLIGVVALVWGVVGYSKLNLLNSAFALLIVGSCFGHAFFHRSAGPLPLTIDRVLWFVLVTHFALAFLLGRLPSIHWNRSDAILSGLLILIAANLVLTEWNLDGYQPVATFLFFIVVPAGSYFVTRHASFDERTFRAITIGSIGFGTYLALTAIAEWRGWTFAVFPRYIADPSEAEFLGRGRGPFLNPVAMGIVQLLCLAVALSNWTASTKWKKVALTAFTLLMLLGCYATLTRSVWLSVAIGLAIMAMLQFGPRGRALCITAGLLGGILFAGGAYDYMKSFKRDVNVSVEEMEESAKLRPLLAMVALKMAEDRPIFGHGFGQYVEHSSEYHFNHDGNEPVQKALPYVQHNVFLSILVDLGLIGLAGFLFMMAYWCHASFQLWKGSHPGSVEYRLGQIGLVLIMSYCVNGMFHDVLIVPMMNMFLFTSFGLIVNRYAAQRQALVPRNFAGSFVGSNDLKVPLSLQRHEAKIAR